MLVEKCRSMDDHHEKMQSMWEGQAAFTVEPGHLGLPSINPTVMHCKTNQKAYEHAESWQKVLGICLIHLCHFQDLIPTIQSFELATEQSVSSSGAF